MLMIWIIFQILIMLGLTRLAGEYMERRNKPALVGEIMVGIILGPAILGYIILNGFHIETDVFKAGPEIKLLADVATFFLVFAAGMEFSFVTIKRYFSKSLIIAYMADLVAFFGGMAMGLILFGNEPHGFIIAFFLGTVFSLTALPVALRMLCDMKIEKTRFGMMLVTTAIFDDLLAMFLLALVVPLSKDSQLTAFHFLQIAAELAVFMVIVFAVDRFFRWRNEKFATYFAHYIRKMRSRQSEFAVILLFGLSFALLGEGLGLTYIIGAFYGGSLVNKRLVGERVFKNVTSQLNAITYGFFAPIFFVYIGLNFNITWEGSYLMRFAILALIFTGVAVVGKTIGGYLGAKFVNIKDNSSWGIGLGLNSRGIMGLIIASLGFSLGVIDEEIFSLLVLVSIITTMMTPYIIAWFMKRHPDVKHLEMSSEPTDEELDTPALSLD